MNFTEHHNQKLENPDYWDMLSEKHGMDPIVSTLMEHLPVGSSIFEFGVGRGRNSFPLAERGYRMTVQDIGAKAIADIDAVAKERGLKIHTSVGDAREICDEKIYDAFMAIRLLHFLPKSDAMDLIQYMVEHTNPGGYNAFVIFIENPEKKAEYYFPSRELLLSQYPDWKIIAEYSNISKTSEGKSMPRIAILLKKPL